LATFNTPRTTYGVASFASRVSAFVADCATAFQAWNDARITSRALGHLTDRELADIGLVRGDIDDVARSHMIR
jgi:uncharacterized protein YjiS (DUF1127 family)